MQETHKHIKIFTDGGARGNPGPAAAGMVVQNVDGTPLNEGSQYLGETTNNQAEYQALMLGLEMALMYKPQQIDCFLDSELVVKQLNGEYKMKNAELKPHFEAIKELILGKQVSFTHVPRERNQLADRLVNAELDRQAR